MARNREGSDIAAIVDFLKSQPGRQAADDAILDYVYGNRSDGGPLGALNCLRVNISKLRREGYEIERKTVYELRQIPDKVP